jgi:transcription antitermination factor NusG
MERKGGSMSSEGISDSVKPNCDHKDAPHVSNSGNWYALEVRSSRELSVARLLRARGYEEFAPCYRVQRKWVDRTKVVDVPYLPGYVLCRYDAANNAKIVAIPGVISIVKFCREPAVVPEEEILSLKIVAESALGVHPCPFLSCGQRVEINSGPLQGARGKVVRVQKDYKLVVSIELLQRSVAVSLDQRWVAPSQEGIQYSAPNAIAKTACYQPGLLKTGMAAIRGAPSSWKRSSSHFIGAQDHE